MKRSGILNPALNAAIARLGHGHEVVVGDCGLPLPPTATIVDLSVVQGVPSFTQVLDALLDELVIEDCVAAEECRGSIVDSWFAERNLTVELISHEDLKKRLPDMALIVRTGEATPYANVILRCGVPF